MTITATITDNEGNSLNRIPPTISPWLVTPQSADDACELIRRKTRVALGRLQDFKPLKLDLPYELRTDAYTEEYAAYRAEKKNGKMVGPKSFVVTADDPRELLY